MASLQKIIVALGHLCPDFILNWAYVWPFWIYKKSVEKAGLNVWYRNSLKLNDLVFGHSDIDVTLYSDERLSFANGLKAQKKLKNLKIVFPHLGELALYDGPSLKVFYPLANPLELSRDPELLERLGVGKNEQQANEAQAQVFALNWLRNDIHKWNQSFESRVKKIRRFFKLLNMDSSVLPKDKDELVNRLIKDCWSDLSQEKPFLEFMQAFMKLPLHSSQKDSSLNDFYEKKKPLRVYLMALYPQLWLGPALVHKGWQEDLQSFSKLPVSFQAIFKEQMNWEVWGLYGQWMREGGNLNFYIHLDALIGVLQKIPGDWQALEKGLHYMKEADPSLKGQEVEVHYASS